MSVELVRARALAALTGLAVVKPPGCCLPRVPPPRAARVTWMVREHGIIPDRAGTHWTPINALAAVLADPWHPIRLPPIRRAYREEHAHALPPIELVYWPDGSTAIGDGNHRLTVAREKHAAGDYQAAWVRVRWARGSGRPTPGQAIRDDRSPLSSQELALLEPDQSALALRTPSRPGRPRRPRGGRTPAAIGAAPREATP